MAKPGDAQPCNDSGSLLGPPRFSLRALLATMSGLCCMFAAMSAMGPLGSIVVLLFFCLAAAHVLGNSLGTRLRDGATEKMPQRCEKRTMPPHAVSAPTRLSERTGMRRATYLMAAGGTISGGIGGALASAALYPDAGPAAVALGTGSLAVLGTFAGFIASSFLSVARSAMREALGDISSGTPPRPTP
jgi:hypothetical protein